MEIINIIEVSYCLFLLFCKFYWFIKTCSYKFDRREIDYINTNNFSFMILRQLCSVRTCFCNLEENSRNLEFLYTHRLLAITGDIQSLSLSD